MKIRLLIILLFTGIVHSYAQSFTLLTWDDLIPKDKEFDDPFEKLTSHQLSNLSTVARYQSLEEHKPEAISKSMEQEHDSLVVLLKSQQINIDSLFAVRYQIAELRRLRAETSVDSLNGVVAQIPGYLLPLDYTGEASTEFLLVPWVGACIHTPPPPKNQIVFLKYPEGFKQVSEFQPVWVEGLMTTKAEVKELYFVDGSDDISTGYTMQVNKIFDFSTTSLEN